VFIASLACRSGWHTSCRVVHVRSDKTDVAESRARDCKDVGLSEMKRCKKPCKAFQPSRNQFLLYT
jgi:hypothetical protein